MLFVERLVKAYRSRMASKEWAEWAKQNPELDAFLKSVEMELNAS